MDNKKPPKKGHVKYLDWATRGEAYRKYKAAREAYRNRPTRDAELDAFFDEPDRDESDLWVNEPDP